MNVPHAAMPDRPEDGGSSHSSHAHRINESSDRRLLGIGLFLIVGFMIVEIAVGLATHSLTLLADAGHMLTDAGALALSIWAIGLALRPTSNSWTFGFKRAEILSAAANGATLLVISIVIAAEAVNRLLHPQPVIGTAMIVVAAVGVIVNIAATFAVSRANQASLNITGALGHLLTDLWAFAGTLVAGVLIVTTGFRRADPIASLLVVALMLRTSWRLLKDSGRILLEAAPAGIDLEEVREHFMSVEHVLDIHDLHAWVVTSDLPALSAHVVIDDSCFTDGHAPQILDQLQRCLTGHFDLDHSTFQLEPEEHGGHEGSTH
jgi:cobalt-zinc-cadmium efflux system protein